MSITGSHVTEISVGERASVLTLVGGLEGTKKEKNQIIHTQSSKYSSV